MKIQDYIDWVGTRQELNDVLGKIERSMPVKFMLKKKTTGAEIPIHDARIRNFLQKNLMPIGDYPETKSTKGVRYSWKHISSYLAAIALRKMKYSDEQIPSILNDFEKQDFLNLIENNQLPKSKDFMSDGLISVPDKEKRASILKELGREEGRALLSEQHLIAVLPWLHLHVSKKRLKKLSHEQIEVITKTIKENLINLRG